MGSAGSASGGGELCKDWDRERPCLQMGFKGLRNRGLSDASRVQGSLSGRCNASALQLHGWGSLPWVLEGL